MDVVCGEGGVCVYVSRDSTLSNSGLCLSHVFCFYCLLVCGKSEMSHTARGCPLVVCGASGHITRLQAEYTQSQSTSQTAACGVRSVFSHVELVLHVEIDLNPIVSCHL